ncbi:MAG: Pyrimidine/purine nucleotide 5'-monophosphate nucleosidase [Paracidovorax wautersii]|uniref:Cytokinin riboside 5'-monophosphate phosphoribohydrolase n=1 Tax=Paracidovorax wautersii TaxID=1177982 RepID=A0A7V8FS22_9BURK|nr:MAG: Pyrimidine/purine nucleotide 5'-monophosphate nucleosidase [Paracidovorax wautersii]
MNAAENLHERKLADAWATLQAHANDGNPLRAESNRIAFADPEFLLRRETRGIRMQLELMKPDLLQQTEGIEHTIVVFGGARFRSPEESRQLLDAARAAGDAAAVARLERLERNAKYYDHARAFGRIVTDYSQSLPDSDRLYICTGGGPGVMEAANRGAHDAGGKSVGLAIALPFEEKPNPYIPPELLFKFHYFGLRKMHFMMRAKAMVAFPGGFGTLDELFETLTLVQCGKSKSIPIVLFGSDYWKRLINFDVLVEEGAISPGDVQLFKHVDTPEEAWAHICDFYEMPHTSR